MTIDAQFGEDLAPAFGDGLLDHGVIEDAGLDHLQHVFHRQGGIGPLQHQRRHALLRQALVDLAHGLAGGAAGWQGDGAAGQLLQAHELAVALLGHQHQRHVGLPRQAGADVLAIAGQQDLPGRDQIAFTALQRAEQLILGLGNELDGERLAPRGTVVEVLLEGAQATVFDANGFALDLAGAVAALVDQNPQGAAGADRGEVAGVGVFLLPVFRLGRQARGRRQWRQGHEAQQ